MVLETKALSKPRPKLFVVGVFFAFATFTETKAHRSRSLHRLRLNRNLRHQRRLFFAVVSFFRVPSNTYLHFYFLEIRAYDKAAINCNGREAVTNFEPSTYEGEMVSEAGKGGNDHNLDLNFGISPPSFGDGSKENESLGHFQYQSAGPYDVHDGRRSRMKNPAMATVGDPPLKGLAITSEHPPLWTGLYPSFFPNYEERARE